MNGRRVWTAAGDSNNVQRCHLSLRQTDDPNPLKTLWVFGNNTLHQFLNNEPKRLTDAQVAALSAELANYIRNYGK